MPTLDRIPSSALLALFQTVVRRILVWWCFIAFDMPREELVDYAN